MYLNQHGKSSRKKLCRCRSTFCDPYHFFVDDRPASHPVRKRLANRFTYENMCGIIELESLGFATMEIGRMVLRNESTMEIGRGLVLPV
jgi:hypothetical protein